MKRTVSILLLITMLLLVALPAGAASADEFTDSADITHVEAVRMLTDLGLLSGYSDGSFCPDVPVTRAQIAKLIALLSSDDPAAARSAGFADVAEDSWAAAFIDYCAAQGIVSGSGGLFRPNQPVTRAEAAAKLARAAGLAANEERADAFADAKPFPEARLAEIRAALADVKGLTVKGG